MLRSWPLSLCLAVGYFVTGYAGLMLPAAGSNITLVWLPTGIAVAMLRRWGYGCWPGVTIGALTVNFAVGTSFPLSLGIALGNTLGPLLATRILVRLGFRPDLKHSRDILLLTIAAAVGMLVTASGGVTCLTLAGQLPNGHLQAWLIWWAGDTTGVIAAAPLVFVASHSALRALLTRRIEFVCWIGLIALSTLGVFGVNRANGPAYPIAFLPLPLLVWGAIRFGPIGTSIGIILLLFGSVLGTATGRGPFYRPEPMESVFLLSLFLTTCGVLGWLVFALNAAQTEAVGTARVLEQALAEASLGVLVTDVDRRITYINKGFSRLTGYSEDELLGKSCRFLQGPETDPGTAEKLKVAVRSGGSFEGDILNYRKDGSTFWNALLISPLYNERGEWAGFLGIQRDVTDRKAADTARREAEVRLRESEARLSSFFSTSPVGMAIYDSDYRFTHINPTLAAMNNIPAAAHIGRRPSELLSPELATEIEAGLRRTLETGIADINRELGGTALAAPGVTRYALATQSPIPNDSGRITGIGVVVVETTALKQAEAALRMSEERFRLAAEAFQGMLYDLDLVSGAVYRSAALTDLLGSAGDEIPGSFEEWVEIIHPDDRPWFVSQVRAALVDQRWFELEYRLRHRDGHYVAVLDRGQIVRGADGAPLRVVGSTIDVSVRKRAETALRESEALYRTLFETCSDSIFLLDLTGRIRSANPAAVRNHGYTMDELLAMRIQDLDVPESANQAEDRLRRMLSGEVLTFEVEHRRKDGTTFPIEVLAAAVERCGEWLVMAFDRDITERKRAAVRQASLATILEESLNEIYIFDRESLRFIEANRAARRNVGYDLSELRQMTPVDLKPEFTADGFAELIAPLRSGGAEKLHFVTIHRRKDGTTYPVEVNLQAGAYGESSALVALIMDITERKRAEAREVAHLHRMKRLAELSLTLSGEPGAIFEQVVSMIGDLFSVRVVCLSEIVGSELQFHAVYANGQVTCDAGACPLDITPCATVEETKDLQLFDHVGERFPRADFIRLHNAYSYCGFPSLDSGGRVVAVTCLLDDKPREFSDDDKHFLRIIGQRISTEVERKRAETTLREAEYRQRLALDAGRMGTWDWEVGTDRLIWDDREQALFDFASGEFDQRLGTFLARVHPDDVANVRQVLVEAGAGKDFDSEFRIHLPNGEVRWIHGTGTLVPKVGNTPARLVGINYDATERKRAEERLVASLREKEALLREVHHRVKNNLQIITSLLNLQAESVRDQGILSLLRESQSRVRAMALVHETLYLSGDFGRIDLVAYLGSICNYLARSYGADPSRIQIDLEVTDATLDLDRAVPCGLIVNELVSNALKHGFPDGRGGRIVVRLETAPDRYYNLSVIDDGVGLPAAFDWTRLPSLGLQLVSDLVLQLGGSFRVLPGSGAKYFIRIPITLSATGKRP